MKPLASRTGKISTSQTVAIDTRFKVLRAQGKNVLSLGAGEPDLDTPDFAKQSAIESIQKGWTKYSAVTGLSELKQAVVKKFSRDNALTYAPDQIVISSGAKHSVFNSLLALVEEEDEVLIPTPCWTTYPELVRFLGGTPRLLTTDFTSGFKLTASQLASAISKQSKLLILNSPCNPTGAVYTRAELESIARVIVENDLYCVSDEIYEYICYGTTQHISIASLNPEIYARTVTINGMSKAFAMTGWRVGYLGAPPQLAKAIASIQSHGTHHPANASQYAALACLESDQAFVKTMREHLTQCRELTLKRLHSISDLQILIPEGAFYVFFGIQAYLGHSFKGKTLSTSMDLCEYFLEEQLLATVPGSAFGLEGFMRISFANSLQNLSLALDRLAAGFAALR